MVALEHAEVLAALRAAAGAPARGAGAALLRRPVRGRHRRRPRHQPRRRQEPRVPRHGRPAHHPGGVPMSTRQFADDDPLAARLRDALTSEAAMVTPSDDGLQKIRAGIDQHSQRPWWRHPATPALAAALVLGVMAGGIAVLAGGNDDDDNVVATQPSTERHRVGVGAAPSRPTRRPPATTDHPDRGRGRRLRLLRRWTTARPAALPRAAAQPGHGPGHRGRDDDARRAAGGPRLLRRLGPRAPSSSTTRSPGTPRPSTSVKFAVRRRRGRDGRRAAARLHRDRQRQVGEEGATAGRRQDPAVRAPGLVAAGRPRADGGRAGLDLAARADRRARPSRRR